MTALGAVLVLAVRSHPSRRRTAATAALAASFLAAVLLPPEFELRVGDGRLVGTPYLRLWLVLETAAFLALHVLGLATSWQRNAPLAMLGALATTAVALAATDVAAGLLVVAAGALVAIVASLLLPVSMPAVRLAADGLRGAALSAAVAVVGAGWVSAAGPSAAPELVAIGFTLMALALVLRMGVLPAHGTSARTAQTAPLVAVPVLVAWLPAAFAALVVSWQDGVVQPLAVELGPVRGLAVVAAVVTVVVTGVASLVQEDVAHIVSYSIVQDAAFVVFALGGAGPAAPAARTWLLLFALVKTASVALTLGLAATFGTRRITDLQGWARRAPPLALALLATLVATYGWPGLLPFEARAQLVEQSIGSPAGLLVLLAGLLPAVAFVRLLVTGLRRPTRAVAAAPSLVPVPVPVTRFRRPAEVVRGGPWSAFLQARRRLIALAALRREEATLLWRLNRAPIAVALVVVLAVLPLALGAGLGDMRAASASAPPLAAGR